MDLLETTCNMNRCVCNNYSFAGFWRSWHALLLAYY
jgi:D-alanyl-lipoteichoic acid acyltransferase DltB (MBOAT superfamily)